MAARAPQQEWRSALVGPRRLSIRSTEVDMVRGMGDHGLQVDRVAVVVRIRSCAGGVELDG
jgi:hypothetical protein